MLSLVKNQLVYITTYVLLMLVGCYFCLNFKQLEISLFVNSQFNLFLDYLFYLATYIGDGVFAILLGLLFMIKDKKLGLTILLTYAISALTAQAFKHTLFNNFNRPLFFVEHKEIIHQVLNIEIHKANSFPSGHTTSAFAIFTILTIHFKKPFFFLLMAALVAYSRIYLFQHFLIDVMAGSFLGIISAFACYNYFITKNKIEPLITIFAKKHLD